MIYLIIFGTPVFFAFLADKTRGSLKGIMVAMALCVPCLFAGARDYTVGTDVMTYGIWTFRAAVGEDFMTYMVNSASESGVGINAYSWLVSQVGSMGFYLGAMQVLVVTPIYLYAVKRYPCCSWPAMAAYMLLLYPISLNTMKQMIAVAFCLLTFTLIERRRPAAFALCVLGIAVLFHQTAIVFLFLYPVVRLIRETKGEGRAFFGRGQRFAICFIAVVAFVFVFTQGHTLIQVFSPLKESYSYQVNAQGTRLNYSSLVMLVVLAFTHCLNKFQSGSCRHECLEDQSLFCALCAIGALLFQLDIIAASMQRFAYYLIAFVPLYVACLMENRGRVVNRIAGIILIAFLVMYFVQVDVINGGDEFYPYTSVLLGVK